MTRRMYKLLVVIVLLLVIVPTASASVRIDDNGQVPFYARIVRNEIIHNGRWAVIVFYRQPSCIPADFNMLDFFDFPDGTNLGAFDCQPPTTDNVTIWKNGPDVDFAPLKSMFRGLGAVPVWFVKLNELEAAVADDVLTIGELAGLPSLMQGSAKAYRETLYPGESHPITGGSIQFNANGWLEDGRFFQVRVKSDRDMTRVRIIFRPDSPF
ncbi:hypothetical protein [Promineifilum sp.]|uniref:hypothetical protein n=1 Tax=Promineifilum sp. TaxID=2664178 RepID=UPI0035AF6DC4